MNLRNMFASVAVLFLLNACSDDKDRVAGVCYCDFANGEKQEYDLNDLTRPEQIEQCKTHDRNAANFGGVCELE